jgi:hypothetical protein
VLTPGVECVALKELRAQRARILPSNRLLDALDLSRRKKIGSWEPPEATTKSRVFEFCPLQFSVSKQYRSLQSSLLNGHVGT